VLVDAPKLLRAVRAILGGDGSGQLADLPRIITTAAAGELHPSLVRTVSQDPDLCNGYRPVCARPGFSLGAYLSQACPALGGDGRPAEGEAVYAEAFGSNPYVQACAIWRVAPAPAQSPAHVPRLVLTGHLDSWSRAEWFDDAVTVRGAAHDVAGAAPCVLEVRNRWVIDPSTVPDLNACAAAPYPDWD
jgi:hypothetical protein